MLAAATELLVEGGVKAVTADAVAGRSGVAKSTLYRQWPSMNDLLLSTFRQHLPAGAGVPLDEGFEVALRAWLDHVVVTLSSPVWPSIFLAMLELRAQSPEVTELLQDDLDDLSAELDPILALGVVEGRLSRHVDPRLASQMLAGPIVVAALRGDVEGIRAIAELVLDTFLGRH